MTDWKQPKKDFALNETPLGRELYQSLFELRALLETQLEAEKEKLIEAKVQLHKMKKGGGK